MLGCRLVLNAGSKKKAKDKKAEKEKAGWFSSKKEAHKETAAPEAKPAAPSASDEQTRPAP